MDHIKTLVPEEVRKEMVDACTSTGGVHACNCAMLQIVQAYACSNCCYAKCEAMFVVNAESQFKLPLA